MLKELRTFIRKTARRAHSTLPKKDESASSLGVDFSKIFQVADKTMMDRYVRVFEEENREFQRMLNQTSEMQTILRQTSTNMAVRYCYLFHAQTPGMLIRN